MSTLFPGGFALIQLSEKTPVKCQHVLSMILPSACLFCKPVCPCLKCHWAYLAAFTGDFIFIKACSMNQYVLVCTDNSKMLTVRTFIRDSVLIKVCSINPCGAVCYNKGRRTWFPDRCHKGADVHFELGHEWLKIDVVIPHKNRNIRHAFCAMLYAKYIIRNPSCCIYI